MRRNNSKILIENTQKKTIKKKNYKRSQKSEQKIIKVNCKEIMWKKWGNCISTLRYVFLKRIIWQKKKGNEKKTKKCPKTHRKKIYKNLNNKWNGSF